MRQVSTTDSTASGRPEKCTARSRKASLASTLIGRGRFRDRSLPGESVRPALTAAPVFVSSGPAPPLCPRKGRRAAFLAGARPPVPVATASPFLQTSQPACPTLRSAPPAPPLSLRPGAPAACAESLLSSRTRHPAGPPAPRGMPPAAPSSHRRQALPAPLLFVPSGFFAQDRSRRHAPAAGHRSGSLPARQLAPASGGGAPLSPPSPAAPVVRRRCHRTAPNNAFLPARIAPGRRPVATPRYRPLSPGQEA